jgi:uncharacterized protein YneF (UPF0154 family)
MSIEMLLIIVLVSFIIGLITGISLVPRPIIR